MRIAVFENLPPGGALRACFEIGRELAARGHELELFRLAMFRDKGLSDLAPVVSAVHEVPYRPLGGALDRRIADGHAAPRSYTLFGPLESAHRRLAEQIRAGRYDVVLLHQDALTQAPYALRWLDGLPTVYYCQEPLRVMGERWLMEQHRRRLGARRGPVAWVRLADDRLTLTRLVRADYRSVQHAKVVVVNSVYSRERVWAAYGREAAVCYLGVDPALFAPAPSGAARRLEVLSVGLPVAAKGHDLIVRALGRIPAGSRPALHLVLPRRDGTHQLEELAQRLGVRLSVDVGLDDAAFADRYRHVMATVCAAHLEPFGLTAIESMACATPVVAIREAGYRETVVDGATGFLVEPDPDALASAITKLTADAGLVQSMGARGREEVLRAWTWKRTGEQMERILERARQS